MWSVMKQADWRVGFDGVVAFRERLYRALEIVAMIEDCAHPRHDDVQ